MKCIQRRRCFHFSIVVIMSFDFLGNSCSIFYIFIVKQHTLFKFISFKYNLYYRRYNFISFTVKRNIYLHYICNCIICFVFVYKGYWQSLAHDEPYLCHFPFVSCVQSIYSFSSLKLVSCLLSFSCALTLISTLLKTFVCTTLHYFFVGS